MLAEDVTTLRIREDADFEAVARPHLAQVRKALPQWAEVVSSGHLEDLLTLSASDAILVPTNAGPISKASWPRPARRNLCSCPAPPGAFPQRIAVAAPPAILGRSVFWGDPAR